MTLENTKASPGFDVPKSDGVVRRPADDQIVVVLQAGDAPEKMERLRSKNAFN